MWHRLDLMNSLGIEVNASRVSDGADYDGKKANNRDRMV